MITLTPYTPADRGAYISLYEGSFPQSERKPFAYMAEGDQAHAYELWVISTPEVRVAGMAITARHGHYVLLDYLAISPVLRGRGIGHEALTLLHHHYGKDCLFLEIESPVPHADNLKERLRRKAFYLSAGLTDCHVHAMMYGTEMELLAFPDSASRITFTAYSELAKALFPPDMTPLPIDS